MALSSRDADLDCKFYLQTNDKMKELSMIAEFLPKILSTTEQRHQDTTGQI